MTKSIYTCSNFTITVNGERIEASTNHSPKYFDNVEVGFDEVLQENVHSLPITMEFVDEEDIVKFLDNIDTEEAKPIPSSIFDRINTIKEKVNTLRNQSKEIHYCQYNDCGWCYYKGDGNSNDNNGQCNKPQQCEVNINGE